MHKTLQCLLCCAAVMWVANAAQAQQKNFDIPASAASVSIPEFAQQAGVQIVAPGERLAGIRTPAVQGSFDTLEALDKLLVDTGLRVAANDGRTITLAPGPPEPQVQSETRPAPARAEQEAQQDQPRQRPPDEPEPRNDNRQPEDRLDRITVTGTFLSRIDEETALPVTTLTTDDIALGGVNTAAELFAQLPFSAEFDNTETATGPNNARGDAASVNLRGLGSGNTLVLINGRRIAPHPIAGGAVPRLSANINQIPLAAVERVEVLRDGASAIYGSDAVAGVINTILKKDYEGAEAKLRYGDVTDGSAGEWSGTLLAGKNFNQGRTNIMGLVNFFDRRALQGRERGLTGDLRERVGSENTRWDNRSISTPYGQFITGVANPDGSFTPVVLPGFDGDRFHGQPTDGGIEITPGALPRELRYDYSPDFTLIPETRRVQLTSTLNHSFSDSLSGYLEGFYYHADSVTKNATAPISANSDNDIFVPADNFYNPFDTDVLIRNYRPTELGPRIAEVESEAYQFSGGLRGFVGDWDWEAGASYGVGETTDVGRNMISESRLRAQLALDTPDAFNVFGGPGANSAEVLDAVRIDTRRTGEAGLGQVFARTSTSLFELPAGSLMAALGGEFRRETFDDSRDEFTRNDDVIALSESADADGSREVYAGFLELSVPLFSEQNALPGLNKLELSAAVRSEDYSDFGTATKPKFGLAWSPVRSLLVRGSYNEGFRAPTLAQVFVGEIVRRNTGTADPYREDVTGNPRDIGDESRQVIRGGNPDLGPEEAETRSFGLVWQLPFATGLSLSADYFIIEQDDVIDVFGEAEQLALDFLLRTTGQGGNPNVVRLPVTPDDQAAFDAYNAANPGDQRDAVGEVDFVRDTFVNISKREVSGFDFGLKYVMPDTRYGRFTLSADVAHLTRFDSQRDAESPVVDDLNINGLPETRGTASLLWRLDNLEAGVRANYISSFQDTSAPTDEDGSLFEVDDWIGFNAFVGGCLGDRLLGRDTCARLGINNLLDNDPPLADESRGFDQTVHDPRGRFVYFELRQAF